MPDQWATSLARLGLARSHSARVALQPGAELEMCLRGGRQQALIDQTHAAVQEQLDSNDFEAEWRAGEKLDIDQALALAMKV